jgi:NAD(P)-dependent dehydrogenase (short-subunit alcohol dehydrogenase family)
MLLAGQGVRVHAVLTGPLDTDMVRALNIPRAAPRTVAQGIFDGIDNGEDDIFPDPCPRPSPAPDRKPRTRHSNARTPRFCRPSPSHPCLCLAKNRHGKVLRSANGNPKEL